MTTVRQDIKFLEDVVGTNLLESAIKWIGDELSPEEVFDERVLDEWAKCNGYREEET